MGDRAEKREAACASDSWGTLRQAQDERTLGGRDGAGSLRGAWRLGWVAALACALTAGVVFGAPSASIQASVDRETVAVGEALLYTITVSSQSGQSPQPRPPSFDGFLAQSSGSSTSLNMTNGTVQLTISSSYQLIAQKEGTFRLGPAELDADGTVLKSNPITITVVPAGAPPQLPSNPPGAASEPGEADPAPAQGGINPKKLFLFADVGRKEVMVGEPLSYYSALLSEYDLAECSIASEALFTGFVVENLDVKRQLQPVTFRGRHYPLGCEVSKKLLIPAAPGTFTIRPEMLRAGVKVPNAQRPRRRGGWPFNDPFGSDDPFDDPIFDRFFGRNFQVRQTSVAADPIVVKVLPLPAAGKPASFSGIIAEDLTISAGLDRKVDRNKVQKSLKETDALNFKVVLSGRGDIRALPKPELALGDGFKEYESKATPEVKVDESGISGRKTFEFVLVPRRSGQLTIPTVEVTYFDSSKRQYRTIRSRPIDIQVAPGEREEALSTGVASARKDVKVLGTDLRYIVESPSALVSYSGPLHLSRAFQLLNFLPFAGFVGVVLQTRRRRWLERDPARARRERAGKAAREAVARARELAAGGSAKETCAQLEEAVLQYLWAKLCVPANSIVVETSDATLAAHGVPAELAARAKELLTRFEMSRYAPGALAPGAIDRDVLETEELLTELERAL
ncbi:MAG: protein BatD [Candidatus Wallbacteria bacterium]|nr:protein BatD [Candidatus Wallbacteria bacterium]